MNSLGSLLLFKTKNFHFLDGKCLSSCKKCSSILTYRAFISVVQVYRAAVGIWRTGKAKISSTSKYWAITTMTVDGISFSPIFQSHLRWWQATMVDKTEEEGGWSLSVYSWSCYKKKKKKKKKNVVFIGNQLLLVMLKSEQFNISL